ncbi:cell wall hydrolase [Halobacillus halophilus]|uniref:Cell wall hydrolase LytE n=1 Tax=Halobacillus halophilus (strain ATCC 35676 / DSM 2266 / JCM 20832 / KCTC 3685 / LMG 17431 / NBRC 102448 / NCIMB 2269) TaxID=866895 RepID=I0JJU7_HALH3|nr:LysM peptidoglycan-binding domain-containing protein [Halobacillus halophilus]ASF38569.1 cell wall hydrolase [Halobacillus halophilus]CCG44416.1 cell wall hydrolase LytE [Halobacillus halophilus DSM 2266]
MDEKRWAAAVCGSLAGAMLWGTAVFAEETHQVESGDTLWRISQKYEASVTQLKLWNDLPTNVINVGQQLIVDKTKNSTIEDSDSPSSSSARTYTVKSGDSLWAIANKHGMSVSALMNLNHLSSATIYPNQKLKVSRSSSPEDSVSSSNLTTPEPVSSFSSTSLLKEAKKYLGTPYQWGGESPSGFDCSGFLQYVFAKEGIRIPRTVASIYTHSSLESVSHSNRQPGDIVFFETYKPGASHAGIYLGNNQFIHSGSTYGISIATLTSNYWSSRYIETKRIMN